MFEMYSGTSVPKNCQFILVFNADGLKVKGSTDTALFTIAVSELDLIKKRPKKLRSVILSADATHKVIDMIMCEVSTKLNRAAIASAKWNACCSPEGSRTTRLIPKVSVLSCLLI